jgi:Uma2 family endonuclease
MKSVVSLRCIHVLALTTFPSLPMDHTLLHTKGRETMATIERLSVVTPADWVPGPPQGSWTYEDYAALTDDGQRYEIVNGVLLMAPSPTPDHQSITLRLSHYLFAHIELVGLGRVFPSPLDVELGQKNVFQPDVVVVLNAHLDRVAAKKIIGAPDLVVEEASPGTAALDRLTKYDVYAYAGVQEYWIVNPQRRTIEVLTLETGTYRSLGVFRGQQTLPSQIVPNFPVRVEQLFP